MMDCCRQNRKVLFVAHIESCFPELFAVAMLLKKSGKYEPLFMFDKSGYIPALMSRDALRCRAEGIRVCDFVPRPGAEVPPAGGSQDAVRPEVHGGAAKALLMKLRCHLWDSFPYLLLRHMQYEHHIKRTMLREEISLLILGLELAHYNTAVYVRAAHSIRIPAMIITDMMTSPAEFGDLYYHHPRHSLERVSNRIVGAIFPKWRLEYQGRRMLRLPSSNLVLVKELLRLAPPRPWQIHSGQADLILVESKRMRDLGVRNGLEASKIQVTGLTSHDAMYQSLREQAVRREKIYAKLNVVGDKPMILLALPQDDQPVGLPLPFPSYEGMCTYLAKSLASCQDYQTVVCLHPSTSYEDVRHLEEWGVKISLEHTCELIPLCYLFVAGMSSTIKWAIACSKPVIAYDYNRQKKDDFSTAKGVIVVETTEEFMVVLQQLTGDKEYYQEVCRRQAEDAGRWGNINGQAGRRILSHIDRVLERSRKDLFATGKDSEIGPGI